MAFAGAAPIIYGLLSDLFPPKERAYVTTCVVLSQGAGMALGNFIAGGFPELDWRTPFVLVSIPTMILAVVMGLTTEDPLRGGAEPALQECIADGLTYEEHLTLAKFRKLCKTKTNLLVIFQVRYFAAHNVLTAFCSAMYC
jgi:MFS family permease